MQPFPQWLPVLPPVAKPPAPTQLELAQLHVAAEQAQWTKWGVIVQAIAGAAAGVAIYFAYRTAVEAQRQADAVWLQLEGDRSARAAESLQTASEFLSFLTERFTQPEQYPQTFSMMGAIEFCESAHRNATLNTLEPVLADYAKVQAHGIRFAGRILEPGSTEAWIEVVDALRAVEFAGRASLNAGNRNERHPLDAVTDPITRLRTGVGKLRVLLESASRNVRKLDHGAKRGKT